jgi:two-component system, sensor histidine kinase PdtaS
LPNGSPTQSVITDARLRLLLDGVRDYALLLLDPIGKIVWSAGTETTLGYAASEIMGQPFDRFYAEDAIASDEPSRERAVAVACGRFEAEGWRIRKNGTRFWANVVTSSIRGEGGTLEGFAKLIRDVSERRRMETRFRQVVEAAPNAMVMVNQEGTIDMVNAQAEAVFGYRREDMLGQPIEMLIPPRLRGNHPNLRGAFFAAPRTRPMGADRELYAMRGDGSEFPVEIGLNPIETAEGAMVLSSIVDISERKSRRDRLQAALEEKNILLGEIHHRVKNNLQIVHSLLDLQSARLTDPLALEMLRDSQSRIHSMALIHQTLYGSNDFGQVDFGSFLDALVPALIESYRTEPGLIRLEVDTTQVNLPIDLAVPCGLAANELITNALKHAYDRSSSGEIFVSLRRETPGTVTLAVSDLGKGLPPDLDTAQTETLGLKLVGLLAEQLGGTLTINRANPTRFAIQFPVAQE